MPKKKRHVASALSEGSFKRDQLRGFEAEHLLAAFDPWIDEVHNPVNDGKEATVYRCRARRPTGERFYAAKVYRARKFRAFRKDRDYYVTRHFVDRRQARAMASGSRRGRDMSHYAWVQSEWDVLEALYEAGADVPEPVASSDDAILMEYVGDETLAAPMLVHAQISKEDARYALDDVLRNVEIMLSLNLVHGDLSAYNILYWNDRITIIDVPQAIDVRSSADGWLFLLRDVENVCAFFAKRGIERDAMDIATDLWSRYKNAEL